MNSVRCFATLAVISLLLVCGCGGGGGGNPGVPAAAGGGTIFGKIAAPVALSQRTSRIFAQAGAVGAGVARAMVWLEGNPDKVTLSDDAGNFSLTEVPFAVSHRVICRFDNAASGEVFLVRSAPFILSGGNPVISLGELTLEPGLYSVSGVLRNQLGQPIPNAQLSLWGIRFKSGLQGSFVSPPLPESASSETIKIEAAGYRPCSFDLSFLHSRNNSMHLELTLTDLSEPDVAPVVFFTGVPAQIAPGERVQLQITIIDPDELNQNHFLPVWSSPSGQIETTSNPLMAWWTAPAASGLATVSVAVADSRGIPASASIGIGVGGNRNPVLRIDGVSPAAGAPGTTIVISGSGFGDAESAGSVSFNGTAAAIESWSDQKIVTRVPAGATTGLLLVSGTAGEKSAGVFNILDAGLSISPGFGPPGTQVVLAGNDFGVDPSIGSVLVNGTPAVVQLWSDTQIRFVIPEGATAGVVSLNLRGREKLAGMFGVTRVFSVSALGVTSGVSLTINGEGWGEEKGSSNIIFAGGVAAPVISWSDTRVVVKVPSGAITGDLTAQIQGITFVAGTLTINAISQIVPERGIAGDEIVVSGSGFGDSVGTSFVTIGETRAEIVTWSNDSIKIRIAAGTRPGNLVVHANGIDSNGVPAVVSAVTSVSFIRRPVGASIRIYGYGFGQEAGFVLFGDAIGQDFSLWQDDAIEVKIPGNATGSVPLVVSTMGVHTPAVPFFVTRFDNIDQTEGWPGREVVVSGSNFGAADGGDGITFNGVAAPVISWGNSEIRVRVPTGTTTGPMIMTISSYPMVLEEEFLVANTYDYAQVAPDWSGQRANSRPLLPGLAEDGDGNFFITDFDNGWVWKIAADGGQTKFGNLDHPWGIAISPLTGNLYVADSGNHCIRVFDGAGNFIETIGSAGAGDGEFSGPRGLAFDKDGRLYIADSLNNRIQVFEPSPALVFLTSFGLLGAGNGQFVTPSGVAVDSVLTVYVADSGNHRIQRFTPDNVNAPSGWNFSGWLGSKDPNVATPGWLVNGSGLASTRNGGFNKPYGVGLADDSSLLVADTNNNRIQVISAVSGQFTGQIGAAGTTSGQYNQPLAVVYHDATVCIADSSNSRIQKSTIAGAFIAQITPDTSLLNTRPGRILVDSLRKRVYVLDIDDGSISVFGFDGNVVQIIGSRGAGANQLYRPEGLALDSAGTLFVADSGNARIQIISPEGEFIGTWGVYGTGDGQFLNPRAIAVSSDGAAVFVVDSELHRVQKFSRNGEFIARWGSEGNSDDNFAAPSGIAIDKTGLLYVADTQNHRIKKYTSDGSLIGWWGSYDAGAQSFWLDPGSNRSGAASDADGGFDSPTDVAVDGEGNVFVADSGNFRVQRFSSNQADQPAGGYAGEIYSGDNIAAVAVDDWATVYTIVPGALVRRYSPEL